MPLWGIAILTEVTHGNFTTLFTLVLERAHAIPARQTGRHCHSRVRREVVVGARRARGHTSRACREKPNDRFAKLALKLATLTYYIYAKKPGQRTVLARIRSHFIFTTLDLLVSSVVRLERSCQQVVARLVRLERDPKKFILALNAVAMLEDSPLKTAKMSSVSQFDVWVPQL